MKQIMPPDLRPFDRKQYLNDLEYRLECDLENIAERRLRLALLFNSDIEYEIDY